MKTNNIKKFSNNFSFVDTLANFVENQHTKQGYIQLKNGIHNERTYIWEALSAVGQDIGQTIYSNVLNYVDNASNIDLCKIVALKSMMQMYGIKNSMDNIVDNMPIEILNTLDLLSINKKYLTKYGVLDTKFAYDIIYKTSKNIYEENQISIQHEYLRKFRNKYKITNPYKEFDFCKDYSLCSEYDFGSLSCNVDNSLSINVVRCYVEDLQNTTSAHHYEFNRFNVATDDYQSDQIFYGLFSISTDVDAERPTTKIIGLVYDLDSILNKKTNERRRYGRLILNLKPERLFRNNYNENDYDDYDFSQFYSDYNVFCSLYKNDYSNMTRDSQLYKSSICLAQTIFNDDYRDQSVNSLNEIADAKKEYKKSFSENFKKSLSFSIDSMKPAANIVNVISCMTDHEFVERNQSEDAFDIDYAQEIDVDINENIIDDEKYYDLLSSLYYSQIEDVCESKYITNNEYYNRPIYQYISADLFDLYRKNTISSDEETKKYKLKNNIDLSFDEKQIANDIENGLDLIENYDGFKKTLVQHEIDRRHQPLPYAIGELATRTSYYREQKVIEYFRFVEQNFYNSHEIMLSDEYILDNSYIQLDPNQNKYVFLLNNDGTTLNKKLIEYVANDLAKLTLKIANLRDNLKIQAQKYYMKGTFNLLSYLINEYLVDFSKYNSLMSFGNGQDKCNYTEDEIAAINSIKSKLSSHMYDDIKIVEYDDQTEYYNIETSSTQYSINKTYANDEYWKKMSDKYKNATIDIDNFYLNELKCKNVVSDVKDFLQTIYEIGADDSYIDSATSSVNVCENELSDMYFMNLMKWTGLNIGMQPWYTFKNQTHPSYQIHPNLFKYIESTQLVYSIKNSFQSGIATELEESIVSAEIAANIGKYGQTIDLWKTNAFDFTGYQTTYESGSHKTYSNSAIMSEVVDYEGAFYPPAVEAYISNREEFIESLKTRQTTQSKNSYYERFYKHLNLSDADLDYIIKQLESSDAAMYSDYYSKIKKIVTDKTQTIDIYKYAKDRFGNSYILYKYYKTKNLVDSEKENVPGELWIRLKNHPIAFPAFSGKYPNIDLSRENSNGKIVYLASNYTEENGSRKVLLDDMTYIYDFDLDSSLKCIFLNTFPVNNPNYTQMSCNTEFYKHKEQSDILICIIDPDVTLITNKNTLAFLEDDVIRYDSFENRNILGKKLRDGLSSIQSFVGYYKTTESTIAVYVDKYFDDNDFIEGNLPNISATYGIIDVNTFKYTCNSQYGSYSNSSKIDIYKNGLTKNFQLVGSTTRFSYYDDVLAFAFLTTVPKLSCRNYIGYTTTDGKMEYPTDTIKSESTFDSFDYNILVVETKVIGNDLYVLNTELYNLNSDASYVPQYPGQKGKNNLYGTQKYAKEDIVSLELLGFQKDIDDVVAKSENQNNLDFDISNIDNILYGRVYEDYDYRAKENLVRLETNNAIYTDSRRYDKQDYFTWTIQLTGYSETEIAGLDLVLFNTSNPIKPYYAGSIHDIMQKKEIGEIVVADNYISSDVYQESKVSTDVGDVKVAGTFNFYNNPTNKMSTNHIHNINRIEIEYDSAKLTLKFFVNDKNVTTYIDKGLLTMFMYNKYNLIVYNYFHYISDRCPIHYDKYLYGYSPSEKIEYLNDDKTLSGYTSYQFDDAYVYLSDLHDDNFQPIAKSGKLYIKDIVLTNFNSLSSISALNGYDNYQFKYNDEDVYQPYDTRFYYPGLNKSFPMFDVEKYKESISSNYSNLFDQKNLYIFQLEDNKTFAENIGSIDIPIENNEVNCLRVYEDYDPQYGPENPDVLKYAHFTTDSDSIGKGKIVTIDEKDYIEIDVGSYSSIDTILENLSKNGFRHINTEDLSADYELQTLNVNINKNNLNLDELLNMYVNYKKAENGDITLYFNYINLLNTPFNKFKDGKVVPDTIENSYLKVGPGENGLLNIVLQFKAYFGDNLFGYINGNALTYKIYNTSDDKPKFVCYKMSQIAKDSLGRNNDDQYVSIIVKDCMINLDDESYAADKQIDAKVRIEIASTTKLKAGLKFTISFHSNELIETSIDASDFQYDVDQQTTTEAVVGTIDFTSTKDLKNSVIYVNFKTKQTKSKIVSDKVVDYRIDASNAIAFDTKSNNIEVDTTSGYMIFGYEVLLRKEVDEVDQLIASEDRNSHFIMKST